MSNLKDYQNLNYKLPFNLPSAVFHLKYYFEINVCEIFCGCVVAVAVPCWQETGVRGFWARIRLQHAHLTAIFAKVNLHH